MPKYNEDANNGKTYSEKNLSGFKQWLQDMGVGNDDYESIEFNLDINPILNILDAGFENFDKDNVKEEVGDYVSLNIASEVIYKVAFLSNGFKEFQAMIKTYEEEMRREKQNQINNKDNNNKDNNNDTESGDADIIDFQKFFDRKNNKD